MEGSIDHGGGGGKDGEGEVTESLEPGGAGSEERIRPARNPEDLARVPERPGVYLMRDPGGQVIYVGKARSLRPRLRSYFQPPAALPPRTAAMMARFQSFEYIVTSSEVEALILESNLIKRYKPHYNIRIKDDKNYPYLRIDLGDPFPRLEIARSAARDDARYYGPYTDSGAVREAIKVLRRLFPVRSCRKRLTGEPGEVVGRPCLNRHIGLCPAPCQGRIGREEYRENIRRIGLFLEGKQEDLVRQLRREMEQAAADLNFEYAARLRDQLQAVEKVVQRQQVASRGTDDLDVVGLASAEGETAAQVFFVREGKVVGREHFLLSGERSVDGDLAGEAEILGAFVKQFYHRATRFPPAILLPLEIPERDLVERWLSEAAGHAVRLRVPRRGAKRSLVSMATENALLAAREIASIQERRDARARAAAGELQEALALPAPPRRIEAYDISNLQGREAVGSMVVLKDGEPARDAYARFKVRTVEGADDFAMLREVLTRRFRYLDPARREDAGPDHRKALRFQAVPDLVLVDGGKGQLGSVLRALAETGVAGIPVAALAKEHEEIHLPGRPGPLRLRPDSPALHLLMRARDEAHRYALEYHRGLRKGKAVRSVLLDIPGIGKQRRRALLKHFGSLERIRQASREEITQIAGIGPELAGIIFTHLHPDH
ncbi:MAG: excinuclease ABC subunit UvrC [Firmicutes bacterium]|nr:excinuclease ABC subunit UvrC [Bacillota bacterium]